MANAVNWFEIPALDFDRAVKFYNRVIGSELSLMENMGVQMAFFPCDQKGVGGSVIQAKDRKPSANGTVIYLNGGADLSGPLSRVEPAGGKVVMPKTQVSDEVGYIAMFIDSEGNKVALHSPPSH